MSTTLYKKSYEGDYTKKYKNYITWRKESEEKRKEYSTISKKLNDTPYNKTERSSQYNTVGSRPKESERVYADGRGNKGKEDRGQIKRNWSDQEAYSPEKQQAKRTVRERAPEIDIEPDIVIEEQEIKKEYTPPPIFQEIKEEPQPWKNAYEIEDDDDDGNYNFFAYPIEEIGFEKYKNLKTKKEIGIDEARDVLQMAGYESKPNNNIGAIAFAFIAANVVVPLLAPLVAMGYGLFRLKMDKTTWIRGTGSQVYKYSLPSSDSEKAMSKIIGKIAIGIGVIAAFIRYSSMM